MVPIKIQLDNDDHYEGGNNIQYIVIHDTGNYTDSDEGNANYFCTGSRGASAHYFVDDDSITQVVLDKNSSWHCGDGRGAYGIHNRNSLGIEQCRVNGVVTDKTMLNTLELVKVKMAQYGVPLERVVRHYDASRKNCPASFNLDGKWTKWFEFKAKLEPPKSPQPTTQSPSVKELQKALNILRFKGSSGLSLVEDGITGGNTVHATKSLQAVMGIQVDGIAGSGTWSAINQILSKPVLTVNSTSKYAVRYVQYRVGSTPDGQFGNLTARAVVLFQKNNSLSADGVIGANTWGKLLG